MGQEASLPAGEEDFEEQARAPPSSTNPQPSTRPAARPAARMMSVLKGKGGGGGQQHTADDFHDKESARAAAMGGNLYLEDSAEYTTGHASSSSNNGVNGASSPPRSQQQAYSQPPYSQDSMQQQQYYAQQQQQQQYYDQQQYYAQQQHAASQPPPPYYPDPPQQQQQQQPAVVGVMYEKTGSKKSLFPGRASARGAALINSMRNLSLGVRKHHKEEVNDWEKQWDEDEDDSEGEDESDLQVQQQQQASTMPLYQMRPGMDAGHSAPDSLLQAQQLASPSATPQPNAAKFVTPETPDLLSKPIEDGVEWDTGAEQQRLSQQASLKPNVQMFMPMLRVLGKGSFGKVVLVQKRVGKERGQLFAMKILRKTHLVKRRQIERTRTERKVLSVVNHPFIMKLHYAFQTEDKLYLVLDYCPGGELFFHLSRFRRFPERVARFYAAELLLAIGHLHKRGIIYRDLKPENVLLDAEGHVKLGDFGLAKAGIKHACEGATSMCGTPEYMAPEVLAQAGHGFCVDYWGLGMLVYEMMTGLPPWYTTDRAKLFRRLKNAPLDIPSYFSAQSASCVSALLERNPRRRLGVTGIRTAMEHEFFRNISWKSLYSRRVEAPVRPCEGWKPPEAIKDDLDMYDGGSGTDTSKISDVNTPSHTDLEAATANFDNTFTRMPVESEDQHETHSDDGEAEELNEDTFVGFSFDIKDRESGAAVQTARQRTHHQHFQQPLQQSE